MFEPLKRNLIPLFEKAVTHKFFSGAAVGISLSTGIKRKNFIECYGKTAYSSNEIITPLSLFDLASLTKPLATAITFLCLVNEKKISLEDSLDLYFDTKFSPDNKSDIKIKHLLGHCSGLPAYKTYYKELAKYPFRERKKIICKWILSEKLEFIPQKKTLYSDLGYILLDSIVEKKTGTSLEKYLQHSFPEMYGKSELLLFNPLQKNIKNCVATEFCSERRKLLCGEVHDENTFYVGGVSGQAGLFGSVKSVLNITSKILDMWAGIEKNKNIDNNTLKLFLETKNVAKSSWVLGFDTPSEGYTSSGRYLDKRSVGHLGFSGTSFWIDPEREVVIVLLTNRIHPTRENNSIREFRPLFHDTVIESLGLQ